MINSNENTEKLEVTEESSNKDVQNSQISSNEDLSTTEKLETKGLKLRKLTKERLNNLQSKFGDAESMISTLITQYESIKIQNDSKFADRKAEIDKFNYLIDALRGSYLNSLDMASYMEERYIEKFETEIKKREKLILNIQEDNNELKKQLGEKNKTLIDTELELKDVKDSFSKINLALTTVEKDSNEKTKIIDNLQSHISSLTDLVNEQKTLNKKHIDTEKTIHDLKEELKNYEFLKKEHLNLNKEVETFKEEVVALKEELKKERSYSNDLNEKIHTMLISNSSEIAKINNNYKTEIKALENEKNEISQENLKTISELKETIYSLKLELLKSK